MIARGPCESKVDQRHLLSTFDLLDEEVVGGQISMNDSLLVQVVHDVGDLKEVSREPHGSRDVRGQQPRERGARLVLHGEEGNLSTMRSHLSEPWNLRVCEAREEIRFTPQLLCANDAHHRIVHPLQNLESDVLSGVVVDGLMGHGIFTLTKGTNLLVPIREERIFGRRFQGIRSFPWLGEVYVRRRSRRACSSSSTDS